MSETPQRGCQSYRDQQVDHGVGVGWKCGGQGREAENAGQKETQEQQHEGGSQGQGAIRHMLDESVHCRQVESSE